MRKLPLALAPLLLTGCAFQVEQLTHIGQPGQDVPDVRDDANDPTDDGIGSGDTSQTPTPNAPLPAWDSSRPFVAAVGDRWAGDLGPIHGIDLPSDLALVYDDGWYTEVEVYALRSDNTRVMLSLAISTDDGQPFLVPGLGMKFHLGHVRNADVWALGCEGPSSGSQQMSTVFEDTPVDEDPCDVSVDTEQDPNDPTALMVTMAATFDDNCDNSGGNGDDGNGVDLPDPDGDGDGDLPPPGEGGGEAGGGSDGTTTGGDNGTAGPLTASASFRLQQ